MYKYAVDAISLIPNVINSQFALMTIGKMLRKTKIFRLRVYFIGCGAGMSTPRAIQIPIGSYYSGSCKHAGSMSNRASNPSCDARFMMG
jgi:hypothetical protein